MRTRALAPAAALAAIALLLALVSDPASARSAEAASTPRCHTINLRIRSGVANGAAGSVILTFHIRNLTNHSCRTRGFAGMQLLDYRGRTIPTHAHHDGAAHTVTLQPNRLTQFAIRFHEYDLAHGGRACNSAVARFARVIPPDEFSFRIVRISGNGIAPCAGRFDEHPVGG